MTKKEQPHRGEDPTGGFQKRVVANWRVVKSDAKHKQVFLKWYCASHTSSHAIHLTTLWVTPLLSSWELFPDEEQEFQQVAKHWGVGSLHFSTWLLSSREEKGITFPWGRAESQNHPSQADATVSNFTVSETGMRSAKHSKDQQTYSKNSPSNPQCLSLTFFPSCSASRLVVSDSLWPHGLYSPWNSPGQNTAVGSFSLLRGIFPTQGANLGLPHYRKIFYQLSHKGSPRILEGVVYPFPVDLPDPGIKPGSPTLQADSLPTELSGKPLLLIKQILLSDSHAHFSHKWKLFYFFCTTFFIQNSILYIHCSLLFSFHSISQEWFHINIYKLASLF